jgi:hypothetical protein
MLSANLTGKRVGLAARSFVELEESPARCRRHENISALALRETGGLHHTPRAAPVFLVWRGIVGGKTRESPKQSSRCKFSRVIPAARGRFVFLDI